MAVDAEEIARALMARRSRRWCPHVPFEKQRQFLALECREALYGGAAAGGKSDVLLMDPLRDVDTPGFSAIIFRRTHTDLAGAGSLMQRSHEWLGGTDAHWDGINKRWTFPSGAMLSFGYLKSEADKYRYKSWEFHSIGFDELTTFTETQYRYLLSRLRKNKGSKIRTRMRAASNPGDIGHAWVKARFVDERTRVKGCAYLPALARDNPFVDLEDYREKLSQLDEVTRRQLEDGVWEQDTSGLVYRPNAATWRDAQRQPFDHYVLALDFGVVDENAVAVLAWRKHERVVWVVECYRKSGSPDAMGEEVRALCKVYPFEQIVGDIAGIGKGFQAEIEQRFGVPIDMAEKQNKLGYIRLLNGALERGELVVVASKCADLRDEWTKLQRLADGREAPSQKNHAADAVLYGWRACLAFGERDKPREKTRDEIVEAETLRLMKSMRDEADDDYG